VSAASAADQHRRLGAGGDRKMQGIHLRRPQLFYETSS